MDGEVRLRNCVAEREGEVFSFSREGSAMNSDVEMEDRLTLKPPPPILGNFAVRRVFSGKASCRVSLDRSALHNDLG